MHCMHHAQQRLAQQRAYGQGKATDCVHRYLIIMSSAFVFKIIMASLCF